eukprot:8467114-Pyramimonas_sp.AAC.3
MSFLRTSNLRRIWGADADTAGLQRKYFVAWGTSILNGSMTVDKAKDIIGRGVERIDSTIDLGEFDHEV